MVDLGKYASDVYAAYGVSIFILAILLWQSLARSKSVKRALEIEEAKSNAKD